jgi:hypothetical protein
MDNAVYKFTGTEQKGLRKALRIWFTPGEASSIEFMYSKGSD